MAVKVKLKNGDFEHFNDADDQYVIERDDKLTVYREDGTTKVFKSDVWSTVDGKERPPSLGFA